MNKAITIFSIILIFLLLFDSIAPLIKVNAYLNIKNIKNSKNYEDKFVFSIEGKNIEVSIDSQYRFYPIEIEDKSFLVGIVNIDNDNDEISKEISRGVFLGKNKNEIINNIINKYKNRIWKYKGKNAYNYSLNNENIIIDLDSLEINKKAKGGIAVIFKVINYTKVKPIQEGFYFSSKCINDGTSNKGKIRIRDAIFDLPFSIKLNKTRYPYEIAYECEEGYEFVNWTINGGYVTYVNKDNKTSYAKLYITNNIGNITAFYKNINLPENITYSINITGNAIVNFKSISINDDSTGKGKIWIFDKIPSGHETWSNGNCYSLSNELKINLTKGKKYYLYYQAEEGYELYNILAYGGIIEEYPIIFLGIPIFKYYVLEIIEDISNVIILYKKKGEEEIKSLISNIHLSSENINKYLNEKNKGKIWIYRINLEHKIIPSINPSFIWEISIKDGNCYSLNNTIKLEKQYLSYPISPYIIKYEAEDGYEFDYFASFGARILSYKDLEKLFIGNVFLENIPENSYFLIIDKDEVWINAYYHNKEPVYGKFKLKSIGNDGTINKGIICINDKQYYLPENSKFEESLLDSSDKRLFNQAKEYSRKEVNLIIGNHYTISYLPEENYDFDKFEINGGKITNKISRLSYDIIIEEKEGEIIAYYKKIKTKEEITTTTTTSSKISTSSIKTTQTSMKTQSIITSTKETKTKTEIKTTSTSTLTITTVTSTITKVDILPPYKAESTSYKSESQTTTVTKTTTTATSTITSITKQEKSLSDMIGETITDVGNTIVSAGKSILEGTIDSISNGLVNVGKSIIEGINDISKRILHGLGLYEENISFSKTNCIITKTESQTYIADVTYEGKTSSKTIKVTSTTTKTNIIITTSIKTTSSNMITTISNYKYVTTKTLITTTTSSKTSSSYNIDKHILHGLGYYEREYKENYNKASTTSIKTTSSSKITTTTKKTTSSTSSYNIDRHIINNLKYYENNYYNNYGKGKIRSSLISNPIIYKEFLEKIKKIEENEKQIPMKYIVYKFTPLRIENQDRSFDGTMVSFKVRTIVKNYDNKERYFLLSTAEIGKTSNEIFLLKPNVNDGFHVNSFLHKVNIQKVVAAGGIDARTEISFWLRPNEKYDRELQVFFTDDDSISFFKNEKHEIGIYLYVKGEDGKLKLIDAEPNERSEKGNDIYTIAALGILKGISEFAMSSLPSIFMVYCPKAAIAIVPILAFYWAEYYKQREIDYELDWRIKEISFKDTSSFIDVYAIRKIIEKEYSSDIVKQINNYLRAIFVGIIDFYDPSNLACVAITNDISVSIAGQINEWNRIVNDPNIRIEDKAAILGRIAGLVFSISFVGSVHSSKSFRDFIDNKFGSKFGTINDKLRKIWEISTDVGKETIGLLKGIADKFLDVEYEADRISNSLEEITGLLRNEKIKKWISEEDIEKIVKHINDEASSIINKEELNEWIDTLNRFNEFTKKTFEFGNELENSKIFIDDPRDLISIYIKKIPSLKIKEIKEIGENLNDIVNVMKKIDDYKDVLNEESVEKAMDRITRRTKDCIEYPSINEGIEYLRNFKDAIIKYNEALEEILKLKEEISLNIAGELANDFLAKYSRVSDKSIASIRDTKTLRYWGNNMKENIIEIRKLWKAKGAIKKVIGVNEIELKGLISECLYKIDDIVISRNPSDIESIRIELFNKLRLVNPSVYEKTREDGTKQWPFYVDAREIENIVGEIKSGEYISFIAFTEDGKVCYVIREIGAIDYRKRIGFGGSVIYNELGTKDYLLAVNRMIRNREELFDLLKGKVREFFDVSLDSFNERNKELLLTIGSDDGKIKMKLKDVDWWYSYDEGLLGLKGKMKIRVEKEGIVFFEDERATGICTDGNSVYMKLEMAGEEGMLYLEKNGIKVIDNLVIMKWHERRGGQDYVREHIIIFDLKGAKSIGGKWHSGIEDARLCKYLSERRDTVSEGGIGEFNGADMLVYYLKKDGHTIDKVKISGGSPKPDMADIHIEADNEELIVPAQSKFITYDSREFSDKNALYKYLNKRFKSKLEDATEQLKINFENIEIYKEKGEFGFIVISALDKAKIEEAINLGESYVPIDTLIVKIYKDGGKPDIIYASDFLDLEKLGLKP